MDSGTQEQAVFELYDASLAQSMPDIIGLWQTQSSLVEENMTFGASSASMPDVPVWRANLPSDLHQADTLLAEGESRLHVSKKALESAPGRMDALVRAHIENPSFSVLPSEAAAKPEAELLLLVSELMEGNLTKSFGMMDQISEGWEVTTEKFYLVLERLRKFMVFYAWVETRVQENFLGRTTVSWGGDVHTIWLVGGGAEQFALHQRTLALAMASRDTFMQIFELAARCAIKLSTLASMPGAVVWVLPVVWKFIHQVLAEIHK